jgi:hypothetical protein
LIAIFELFSEYLVTFCFYYFLNIYFERINTDVPAKLAEVPENSRKFNAKSHLHQWAAQACIIAAATRAQALSGHCIPRPMIPLAGQ